MSLNWLFAILLLLVYSEGFAVEMKFNQLIDETVQAQNQLAQEIQKQVLAVKFESGNEKTLAGHSTSTKIDLEGSFLEIY